MNLIELLRDYANVPRATSSELLREAADQLELAAEELATLRARIAELKKRDDWARELISAGVQIMTPTQVGQWTGVRAWQEMPMEDE